MVGVTKELKPLINIINKVIAQINDNEIYEKALVMPNISHDLRTPVTVILGYAQAIIEEQVKSQKDKDKYIERIYQKNKIFKSIVKKK